MGIRLVTLNLNGIRSAASKGFVAWAERAGADCMGVQEVKAPGIAAKARRESIYLSQRFSDHAPVTVDYDFSL